MESKVVLITGCSSGIGLATALSLAQDSGRRYIVYATMRNLTKRGELEKRAEGALNDTLFILELDVTKEETIVRAVREIMTKQNRIDVLFNNAGLGRIEIFERSDFQDIRDLMDVNFFGAARMIQEVVPGMKQRQTGRIINMSSITGIYAQPHMATYCASKSALEGLTESLAIELRPHGIWVSSIQAGAIQSEIMSNVQSNRQYADNEQVDAKTRASFKAVYENCEKIFSGGPRAKPAEALVEVVHRAMEDDKPHLQYRCTFKFPWESTKYTDEHGDEYVDAMCQRLSR